MKFCADDLMLSFDELKPFSDVLHDETQLSRLHKFYKNLDKYDDASMLRHVVVVVANMENCLQAEPPLLKMLQNCLVELTSLIEKTKETVSRNCTDIAVGVLFKYSGALLHIQGDSDSELVLFLNAVAYHYLYSALTPDAETSAWVALQALEAGAAITYSYVIENESIGLCKRDDLAELCVDSLIPSDGRIQRLHAGVFRDAIATAPTVWPAITVSQITKLFERLIPKLDKPDVLRMILWMIGHDSTFEELSLFDTLLSKTPLSGSSDPDSVNMRSTDVKCFLFTLSLWCDSLADPAPVPARLRIKADQFNCWKAMCQLISRKPEAETVKSVLLRSRVMESVRLRHRVVSLRRLYEVFRWLELNVKNDKWLTLYATTINDVITGVHSHRRKCDDLFPDGNEVDTDLTVDEVDRIEEHVSRYMASQLLRKSEFADAERLLIYANSIDSKKLLIKVYQSWLQEGFLEERDRSQLLKRVRDLQDECQEYDLRERSPSSNSAASVTSAGDNVASAITPSVRKILVDACTNTPNRGDTSMLSQGDDASFFSVRSERTSVEATEESFASAIASPSGSLVKSPLTQPTRTVQQTSPLVSSLVQPSQFKDGVKTQEKTSLASHSASVTSSATVATQFDDVVLPENLSHLPLTPSKSGVIESPGVIVKNSTVPTVTGSPVPILVTKPPFGPPVINKEAATSFWKGGKSGGAPLFGLMNKPGAAVQPAVSPGATASTKAVSGLATTIVTSTPSVPVMQPPFGVLQSNIPVVAQHKSTGELGMTVASCTSVFGGSAQALHVPTTTASIGGPFFLSSPHSAPSLSHQVPSAPNPLAPQAPFGFGSPLAKPNTASHLSNTPNVIASPSFVLSSSSAVDVSAMSDFKDDEEENFCDDLLIEICRKNLERIGKKPVAKEVSVDDMGVLQQKIAEIEKQMRTVQSQLHVNTDIPLSSTAYVATRSAPTQAELVRQHQKEALRELEQQVAKHVGPTDGQQANTSKASDDKSVSCTDPMNLFRGLLMVNNAAGSPSVSKHNVDAAKPTSYSSGFPSLGQQKSNPFDNPLLKMEQMTRHPGCSGICLGCMDDDTQDRALRALTMLSEKWNAETDSDTDTE
ncbi:hypothetical protein Aduo_010285 [Ancylostoma duodenale]